MIGAKTDKLLPEELQNSAVGSVVVIRVVVCDHFVQCASVCFSAHAVINNEGIDVDIIDGVLTVTDLDILTDTHA